MTAEEERKLAQVIEVTRRCFRREVLECHLALARVVDVLKKVKRGELPFDRTIRIWISEGHKRDQILSWLPCNLETLEVLMDYNIRDFQAYIRERDKLVRRGPMADIKHRRTMAADIVGELSIGAHKIWPLMKQLEKAAGSMGALMTKLKSHRAGREGADDPARIRN
jgi:RNA polymerase primary sigma factor